MNDRQLGFPACAPFWTNKAAFERALAKGSLMAHAIQQSLRPFRTRDHRRIIGF